MLKIISFIICFKYVFAYFTLSGRCPDKVTLQEDFKLADFYGKWYQSYHYSSDDQQQNNCSTLELLTRPSGIYLNQSRVDLGLFHRFSVGKIDMLPRVEDASRLDLTFAFKNAPRRFAAGYHSADKDVPSSDLTFQYDVAWKPIRDRFNELHTLSRIACFHLGLHSHQSVKTRRYPFHVLATNYDYYAAVYTCQYSPLIDKHFIYVWILSRNPILNDVSKELAIKPLQQIGVDPSKLVKDDRSKCTPKYYEDMPTEPMTFRFPVPI